MMGVYYSKTKTKHAIPNKRAILFLLLLWTSEWIVGNAQLPDNLLLTSITQTSSSLYGPCAASIAGYDPIHHKMILLGGVATGLDEVGDFYFWRATHLLVPYCAYLAYPLPLMCPPTKWKSPPIRWAKWEYSTLTTPAQVVPLFPLYPPGPPVAINHL